jgi:hypothetical protein
MAQQDYVGSLAQSSISYTTIINTQTVPGQNYWQVGLFVDSVADAPTNLVSGWVVNTPISVNSTNYASVVTASSRLYNWLSSFFGVNTGSTVYIVPYNGTTHDIVTAHSALLTLAYFKMVFFGVGGESNQYQNDVVSLAGQQAGNKLLTQTVVGSSSATLLLASGTGFGNLDAMIIASGYDAMMSYSAVTAYSPAFTALGLAINNINSTGNPVGNNLDFIGTGSILPSTGTANTNLTATQVANLSGRKIGHFSTVGDGSGFVYLDNRFNLSGSVITANWLVNYCNFVCSLKTAGYLTGAAGVQFKNNSTYQQILSIIVTTVLPFASLGRLSGLAFTNTPFNQLPVTGGTVLTIPNAWSANFNDRIGTVTVNGSLNVVL